MSGRPSAWALDRARRTLDFGQVREPDGPDIFDAVALALDAARHEVEENAAADRANDLAYIKILKATIQQLYDAIGVERGTDDWPAFLVRVTERVGAIRREALEEAVQVSLAYRDEADAGKHPDARDPDHSLGQGYAANVIARRIRALAHKCS